MVFKLKRSLHVMYFKLDPNYYRLLGDDEKLSTILSTLAACRNDPMQSSLACRCRLWVVFLATAK